MKRREIIIGASALAATSMITMPAMAAAMPKSPIVRVFQNIGLSACFTREDETRQMRNRMLSPASAYTHSRTNSYWEDYLKNGWYADTMLYVQPRHGIPVSSIEEAEDILLASSPKSGCRFSISNGETAIDVFAKLPIMLNRSANLIVSRTRIKPGNIILVSPHTIAHLKSSDAYMADRENPEQIGRWKYVGLLNQAMRIYTSDDVPPDIAHVAYGADDTVTTPHLVIQSDAGLFLIQDPFADNLLKSQNFFNSVEITT